MPNDDSFHNIFLKVRRSLARVASSIVPPREIEDIVQETYVRICEISKEESINCPKSFMYRVVKNLALDHMKRAETRLSVSLDDDNNEEIKNLIERSDEDIIFREAAAKEEFELFCEAVRQLPLQCRRVFVLKKVYGYSQKEIAIDLNISESTVEKHIAFGIKRCSHFMGFHNDKARNDPLEKTSAKEVCHE